MCVLLSSRIGETRCALVTGFQTCALPIWLAVRILSRQEIGIAEPVAAWALPPPQTLYGVRKRDEPNRPSVIRLKPTMAGTIFNSIILLPIVGSRLDRQFVSA